MDLQKLREAEAGFLMDYPGGFSDPQMASVKKSHNVDKLAEFTRENLTRTLCGQPDKLADILLKIVSRSSMVSRFEKPPFRRCLESLSMTEKESLAIATERLLFGRDKKRGFDDICGLLRPYKIAKWPVVSAIPFYFAPRREVFVKPTTARGIIKYLAVQDLHYEANPTWEFYQGYKKLIGTIKKHINPSITPNNAAVTGFLMISM